MKLFGDEDHLYVEWMSLDKTKKLKSRAAYTFYDVLSDVGGFQQVIIMISAFILRFYSKESF